MSNQKYIYGFFFTDNYAFFFLDSNSICHEFYFLNVFTEFCFSFLISKCKYLLSPRNENVNLLVRIKFFDLLYIYIYTSDGNR